MRYVILGNGVAGMEAALAVRSREPEWEITLISEESDHFFARTALMWVFSGQMSHRDIEPLERDAYERLRLRRVRARATGIDSASHRVLFAGGLDPLAYDRLLIASGSKPRPPRLVDLQVIESGELARRAERQQERLVKLEPKRGNILDRMGRELAVSLDVVCVYGVPTEVENPRSIARELARVLRENPADLERRLASDRRFVWISRKVDPARADKARVIDPKAIGLQTESRRFYPKKTLAGTVLGFTNVDNKGIEGVELWYDKELRGTDGWAMAEKDARGRTVFHGGHGFQYRAWGCRFS